MYLVPLYRHAEASVTNLLCNNLRVVCKLSLRLYVYYHRARKINTLFHGRI